MADDVIFRRYQSIDGTAVLDLYIAAQKTIYPTIEGGDWTRDLENIEAVYIETGGDFLVGLQDGAIVAAGGLRKVDETTVEIRRVSVSPESQGQGLGQRLMELLEQRARELGFGRIKLGTTKAQKAARHIYEKNGYKEIEHKASNHPSGNTFETFYYEKRL